MLGEEEAEAFSFAVGKLCIAQVGKAEALLLVVHVSCHPLDCKAQYVVRGKDVKIQRVPAEDKKPRKFVLAGRSIWRVATRDDGLYVYAGMCIFVR